MNSIDKIFIGIIILIVFFVTLLVVVLSVSPLASPDFLRVRGGSFAGSLLNFFGTIILLLTVLTSGGVQKDGAAGTPSANLPKSAGFASRSKYAVVLALVLIAVGFLLQFSDAITSFYLR